MMTLDHFNKPFRSQFKGRNICPIELYNKMVSVNKALEVVPEDQLAIRFSFGTPDDPNDDLSHWDERANYTLEDMPDSIKSTSFKLYDIYYDDYDGMVEVMFSV